MKNRTRMLDTLNFRKPADRLPMMEWAGWWDKTIERWRGEGLPMELSGDEIHGHLGLDAHRQFWIGPKSREAREALSKGYARDMAAYIQLKPLLYPEDAVSSRKDTLLSLQEAHEQNDLVVWLTLEGFFWFPRTLFGIEDHLYAFYDEPELMHRMNKDLLAYNIRVVEEFCQIIKPEFMTFAEDMSYNLGPMLSYDMFREFLLPYYKEIIPVLKKHGIIPIVDTDGQLEPMIPWLMEAGIEGALPLERQAGVDVNRIRREYPSFKIIGAYDKMVMNKGESAMREEFERILPVMKSGGFIPSCDHQTPPGVSLEDYRLYLVLLEEYCRKAVK
ncbi:MAG: uroporphyrinogen decarboxylase family protein [Clostridia bacterium]